MNDPFVLLPANLGSLASVTTNEWVPYALRDVHVEIHDDRYEVAASDGRHLAVVNGETVGDPLTFPASPELADLPASADSGNIRSKGWQASFRQAGKPRPDAPGTGFVAVHLDTEESLLATTDGDEVRCTHLPNDPLTFPNYRAVLPTTEPLVRLFLNASYLLNLVKLAKEFGPGSENAHRIVLEVRAANQPLVLRARNEKQEYVGLVLPMT